MKTFNLYVFNDYEVEVDKMTLEQALRAMKIEAARAQQAEKLLEKINKLTEDYAAWEA